MMHVQINPVEPWRRPEWVPWVAHAGGYQYTVSVRIVLGTHAFDGMDTGTAYALLADGYLYIEAGYWWDGSTGALNLSSCRLASSIHDVLCAALTNAFRHRDIGIFEYWRLRRRADELYARVCVAQGMWGIWAGIRYIGLRIGGPVLAFLSYIKYRIGKTIRGD